MFNIILKNKNEQKREVYKTEDFEITLSAGDKFIGDSLLGKDKNIVAIRNLEKKYTLLLNEVSLLENESFEEFSRKFLKGLETKYQTEIIRMEITDKNFFVEGAFFLLRTNFKLRAVVRGFLTSKKKIYIINMRGKEDEFDFTCYPEIESIMKSVKIG